MHKRLESISSDHLHQAMNMIMKTKPSKIDIGCAHKKDILSLSERTYECECGLVIDRNYSVSINLLRYQLA